MATAALSRSKTQRFSSFLTSLRKINAAASNSLQFTGGRWAFSDQAWRLSPGYMEVELSTCCINSFLKLWNAEHCYLSHENISQV